MRRNDKEIKDKEIINKILSKSLICRIALFDDEFPYIIPMNFGYSEDTLFFHCAKEGKKIDLIKRNNKVGFEIEQDHEILKADKSCNWTTKYRSLIGTGKIEILEDFNEKTQALDIIMKQHGRTENIYNKNAVNNIVVLKLRIINLSGKQSGEW